MAPKYPREDERLEALRRLNLLDTMPEKEFDNITFLASQICGTPMALVSLVDRNRQWFKAKVGLEVPETPRDIAFCDHVISSESGLMIVPDALKDERFSDNPLVTEKPSLRFYAGQTFSSPEGLPVGTICVLDTAPRTLTESQVKALQILGEQLSDLMELRTQNREFKIATDRLEVQRVAIQTMADGFLLRDREDQLLEFNPAAQATLDLSPQEVLARRREERNWKFLRQDGSDMPLPDRPSARALRTGEPQREELMGVRKQSGEVRWLQASASPITLNNATEPTHTITTFSDVTALVAANQRVEEGQRQLHRILEGTPAGIAYYSLDLRLVHANQAYAELNQMDPGEIRGRFMHEIQSQKMINLNQKHLDAALEGAPQSFEKHSSRGGIERSLLVRYVPDKMGDVVVGLFVVLTDVTEIKQLEEKRRLRESQLVSSSRLTSLGEMAGGVAHEINTPLTIIQMTLASLLKHATPGKFREEVFRHQCGVIEKTVDRIARIIKGLRDFAQDQGDAAFEPVQLKDIVEMTLSLCHERLSSHNVEFRLTHVPDVHLICRQAQVSQVLMNLISNASDAVATATEKWIDLTFQVDWPTHNLKIILTDSGPGVPEEIVDKIMQPFFTTKEVGRGTGLGLSVARGIILAHRGHIYYDRHAPNSRFVVELPCKVKSEERLAKSSGFES